MAPDMVGQKWCLPGHPAWQRAPFAKLVDKLANVPKPIKWLSKCFHWGKLVATPCQDLELSSQAWQRQPVLTSWPRLRHSNWQTRWGPLDRKGGKRGKVAHGSLIESRSGLSWWGGCDDRAAMEGRGGKDYEASGSLIQPIGWPQALALLSPLQSTSLLPSFSLSLSFFPISLFLSSLILNHKEAEERTMPTRRSWGCVRISQSFISKHYVPKIDCIHN